MISNNRDAGNSRLARDRLPDYDSGVKAFLCALILPIASGGIAGELEKNYPPTLSGGAPCGSCNAPEKLS